MLRRPPRVRHLRRRLFWLHPTNQLLWHIHRSSSILFCVLVCLNMLAGVVPFSSEENNLEEELRKVRDNQEKNTKQWSGSSEYPKVPEFQMKNGKDIPALSDKFSCRVWWPVVIAPERKMSWHERYWNCSTMKTIGSSAEQKITKNTTIL